MCVSQCIGVCTCHCSVNSLIMKPFCVPRPQVNWQFREHMYPIYMSTPLLGHVQKVNGAFTLLDDESVEEFTLLNTVNR